MFKGIAQAVVFIFILFAFKLQGQTSRPDTGSADIIQDHRIQSIVEKQIELNKKEEGQNPGYRIQIHFGSERDKAKEVKSQFIARYSSVPAFEKYEQPHFKIRVGNFRTKLEAYKFLKEISIDFPSAFIVHDDIEVPKE